MSRYHSIYATQQKRPSRLPWLVAGLLVVLLSGLTGAMIAQGQTPDDLLDRFSSAGTSPTEPSSAQVPGTAPSATVEAEPTKAAPGEPSATSTTAAEATQAPPTPTSSPTAAPTEVPESPRDVVEAYATLWAAGDFAGLYQLLTTEAKAAITQQDFIDRYAGIQSEAGLTAVVLSVEQDADLQGQVKVRVEMTSSKVGEIEQENTVQLFREEAGWRVAWTPSLIFSQLGDGCVDFTVETVARGSILDRNGELLAYDGQMNVVGIIPGMLQNEQQTLSKLSKLLGMTTTEIKERYQDGEDDWFMPIKTLPEQLDQTTISELGKLAGVAVRTETARIYPLGKAAAHITGYVTRVNADDLAADTTGDLSPDDWIGRAGLEAGANDILSGKPGGRLSVVDCVTRSEREVIAERQAVEPQDIVLTIDKDFQIQVDAALGDVQGSAVILDPRTGAVLAMASRPSFDPNWFVTGFSDKDWAYVNDEQKRPLLNRATEASYPTGSIFKAITMAAGMEHLGYTGSTEIDCPQQWSIPGTDQVWKDWTYEEGLGAQGVLTLHWALVNSCNTVFYQIGNSLDEKGENLLPDMVKAFGLGAPTGIPYLAEVAGIVPDPEWKLSTLGDYWARGDAVNLSIGQGYLEATPLQMAVAYAAIANNGQVLRPFIVEYTQDESGELTRAGKKKPLRDLPVDDDNLTEIQSALRDQTSNTFGVGSARVFGDFAWPIAGKTGTAQNQLQRSGKPHSWFAAFGPYGERATITSIVMVESVGEGVSFAAPRTRQIYEAYLKTDLME